MKVRVQYNEKMSLEQFKEQFGHHFEGVNPARVEKVIADAHEKANALATEKEQPKKSRGRQLPEAKDIEG